MAEAHFVDKLRACLAGQPFETAAEGSGSEVRFLRECVVVDVFAKMLHDVAVGLSLIHI